MRVCSIFLDAFVHTVTHVHNSRRKMWKKTESINGIRIFSVLPNSTKRWNVLSREANFKQEKRWFLALRKA